MYITRLNVLSPRKKTNLRRLVYFQFVKNVLEILLIIISVFGILLLSVRVILIDYFSDLTSQSVSMYRSNAQKNRTIREINRSLLELSTAQKEYRSWTPLVQEISAHIPPRVELSRMAFTPAENKLLLTGIAETREDLLALKKELESLERIESVDISLEQLTAQQRIPFSLTIPLSY